MNEGNIQISDNGMTGWHECVSWQSIFAFSSWSGPSIVAIFFCALHCIGGTSTYSSVGAIPLGQMVRATMPNTLLVATPERHLRPFFIFVTNSLPSNKGISLPISPHPLPRELQYFQACTCLQISLFLLDRIAQASESTVKHAFKGCTRYQWIRYIFCPKRIAIYSSRIPGWNQAT